jgi:hypothetical protein
VEPQTPALLDIDAVEHERMDVDVQIQGGAEALNDRYGPAAPIGHAGLAGLAPKAPEDAPRLAEKSQPDWVIQAQMGHVSPAMMRTYSHIRRKALDEAATALEPSFKLKFPRHLRGRRLKPALYVEKINVDKAKKRTS